MNSPNSLQLIQKILDEEEYQSGFSKQQTRLQQTHGESQLELDQNSVELIIELDSQNRATLVIHKQDDPLTLAKRFCYQYNIDPRVINSLAKNIKQAKQSLDEEDQEKENSYANYSKQNYTSNNQNKKENYLKHNASASSVSKNTQNMQQNIFNTKSFQKKNHNHYKSNQKLSDSRHDTSFQSAHHLQNTSQPRISTHANNNMSILSRESKDGYKYHSAQNSQAKYCQSSVFDRLYQDSRNKQMRQKMVTLASQTTRKQLKQRNSILNTSHSQNLSNLYEKNTKLKQETKRRNQIMLQYKAEKQLQKCTHQPMINPVSKIIAQKLRDQQNYSRISTSQEKRNSRIISYLRQRQCKQLEQCTFQPKLVTKTSNKNLMTPQQRFTLLYQDHNIRMSKQKMIKQKLHAQNFAFEPKINKVSNAIVNGKTFFDRLKEQQNLRRQKEVSLEKLRRNQQNKRPETGRGPMSRNKGRMNIGQYLYEQHKSKTNLSGSKSKSRQKIKHIIPKSQAIYEERKKMAFRYLFALMDDDQDGFITPTKIGVGGLNQEIIRLISPLLAEMEELKASLDQEQFIESISKLFNTFSIHQKNCVLNIYKHQLAYHNNQQPSFHPEINSKSELISKESRKRGASLYELWKQNNAQKQERLQKMRTLKLLQEYQQCTFHPNLFPME